MSKFEDIAFVVGAPAALLLAPPAEYIAFKTIQIIANVIAPALIPEPKADLAEAGLCLGAALLVNAYLLYFGPRLLKSWVLSHSILSESHPPTD